MTFPRLPRQRSGSAPGEAIPRPPEAKKRKTPVKKERKNKWRRTAPSCGKLMFCITRSCVCVRAYAFPLFVLSYVRALVLVRVVLNSVFHRTKESEVDTIGRYMDETGFVYESNSGKSNLHPSYNPVSSGIVDESGIPYSALGIPAPSYLTVPASAAAAANGPYYSDPSGPSGPSGSPGSPSSDNSPFKLVNGEMQFSDPNLQAAWTMIQQTAKANNAWSAEQAQKQMDFQKMMSDTAHQREVADLKAAGLNPVLSAGGSGAQVTSGAMGQVDNSNTRLVAELAGAALDAVTTTALGVSGVFGSSSKTGSALRNNYFLRRAGGTAASVAAALITRKAVGAMLAAL